MQKNPSYSMRAFARDLGIVPSRMSEIMSGKRGISLSQGTAIAKCLPLDDKEKDIFLNFISANHSRSASEKSKAREKLATLLGDQSFLVPVESGDLFKSHFHKEPHKTYHRMLQIAAQALVQSEMEKCHFSGITIWISEKQLEEARKLVRDFHSIIRHKLQVAPSEEGQNYALNIQIVPVISG